MSSPLIAGVDSTRSAWTGAGLADSFQGLYQSVQGGGWVDQTLAGGSFAVEVGATVLDPFSALLSNGLGWAMEYFAPLRDLLDALAGIPDRVAAHAATWDNMSAALESLATDLDSRLESDLPDWQGAAAESYLDLMDANVDAMDGAAVLAAVLGEATRAAGNLVQFTRDIVRDLITDLVAGPGDRMGGRIPTGGDNPGSGRPDSSRSPEVDRPNRGLHQRPHNKPPKPNQTPGRLNRCPEANQKAPTRGVRTGATGPSQTTTRPCLPRPAGPPRVVPAPEERRLPEANPTIHSGSRRDPRPYSPTRM